MSSTPVRTTLPMLSRRATRRGAFLDPLFRCECLTRCRCFETQCFGRGWGSYTQTRSTPSRFKMSVLSLSWRIFKQTITYIPCALLEAFAVSLEKLGMPRNRRCMPTTCLPVAPCICCFSVGVIRAFFTKSSAHATKPTKPTDDCAVLPLPPLHEFQGAR